MAVHIWLFYSVSLCPPTQITFEEEKLRALRRYIAKRDSTLEAELQKAAQRLYEKVVPAAVQEYISDCEQDEPVRKPQKKPEAQV